MSKKIYLRIKLLSASRENKKVQPNVPVVHINFRKFWYAAASFILLAALGSTLYFSLPGNKSNNNLFNQYYSEELQRRAAGMNYNPYGGAAGPAPVIRGTQQAPLGAK